MLAKLSSVFKSIYLFIVSFRSRTTYKKNKKVIFLLSFPSTSRIIIEALYNEWGKKLVICYTPEATDLALEYARKGCEVYPIHSFKILISHVIPLITGAKVILCDNYFAFLSGIKSSKDRKVVQVWHANGAIKNFGLSAKYAKNRSKFDQKRYKEVYKMFTHYVVSSDKMKSVFERNYQLMVEVLPYGYPPTDNFLDNDWMSQKKATFRKKFPTTKKIMLYAPTYREKKSTKVSEFKTIVNNLQDEWLIFVKPHPHEMEEYQMLSDEESIVFDFKGLSLEEILPSVDCLITDYSSIPFEYSLANPQGKVIFYCYDFLEYEEIVGIENDFRDWAPGEIVYNETNLLRAIQSNRHFSFERFNKEWNQFVTGASRTQIIEWVRKHNEA